MYEYLDRRYAAALYKIASAKNKTKEYIEDLKQINEFINKNKELNQVINNPKISTSKKKEVFINIFKGNIDAELLSFLLILIDKKRIDELTGIIVQMEKVDLENHNQIIAEVKTVIPLNDSERTSLVDKLKAKYNKSIILKEIVDESIIGGVYVRIGDDVIDGTIKNKLEEMKKLMLIRG
ncbi:F0F1 ATP synthase subunit delta [Clostridium sp.]|jgi:F-type H+-transporting ATPase subunit delta|uniref:F0F1 ATP synthase subunit delta n=1 Tax=Clostridium sp. TaxID=1506 RepID=UPI00258DE78B|nr:F0F1 ATP synthase subunit delta [Clostridium sp.]MDF2503795.1 synthase, delta subunit [Clostridium sp.]